jgi:hypothetical protein
MGHRFVAQYKRILVQFGAISDYDVPTNFHRLSEQAEIRGLDIDGLGVTVDAHNHQLARILGVNVFNVSTDEFLQFLEGELTSILGSHIRYCPFASVQKCHDTLLQLLSPFVCTGMQINAKAFLDYVITIV